VRAWPWTLVFLAVTGCASTQQELDREGVEQFVVAVRACIPAWFLPTPTLEADPLAATTILVAQGDFSSQLMAPYGCVLAAGSDCDAVRACYGLRSDATTGPCMGTPPRCDGDTLLVCVPAADPAPTQTGRVDCTLQGASCIEAESGGVMLARCARARCDTVSSHCEGDTAILCDGIFESSQHAPAGSTCTDGMGFVHFVANGAPCTATQCVGTELRECDFESSRVGRSFDCAALGQSCSMGLGRCSFDAAECPTPFPFCPSTSILQYCGTDGRPRGYDCVAHGWAGCEEVFAPERGVVIGTCAPVGARF
jgi:hypothetical protein